MKKCLLFTVLFFVHIFPQSGWFQQNPLTPISTLYDVKFVSALQGWAVGANGEILVTSDGGQVWSEQTSNSAAYLYSIFFIDENMGWVVGSNGTILHTTNGGINWVQQISGTTNNLYGLCFTDINNGLIVGEYGTILKTENEGTTWFFSLSGTTSDLRDVCFTDTYTGTIVGSNGTILQTIDGGQNWLFQNSGTQDNLSGVLFTDINHGWVISWEGEIFKTSDAGDNWSISFIAPTWDWYTDICSSDANTITVAGSFGFPGSQLQQRILRTTDAGETWNYQETGFLDIGLSGISFSDTDNGWVVGECGFILKTTDGGYIWELASGTTYDDLYDVSFFDVNVGMAVGASLSHPGDIVGTTDGGLSWTLLFHTGWVTSIYLFDDNNVWAVGEGILHSSDGGNTWVTQLEYNSKIWTDVFFTDINTGIVVGKGGTILRTTDGGTNWISQDIGISNLTSMSFADANNGLIVGDAGTILRTIDGGINWIQQNSGTSGSLRSVCYVNENFAVIVSAGEFSPGDGIILRTTDGGTTWSSQEVDMDPYSVSFADEDNGIVVGDNGKILLTTNGGEEWFQQISNTTKPLLGVSFIDTDHAVAVGYMGLILRTNTGGFVPVELTSFSAKVIDGNVTLSWSTASETNNRGFEVQRSSDNHEYGTIGFVKGNGTTTAKHTYCYADNNADPGTYSYRLKQYDFDGSFQYSNVVNVDFNLPLKFALEQNFPNPFNPNTIIRFSIADEVKVNLTVYDILGEKVRELKNEVMKPGYYEVKFNADGLASGVYFCRIKTSPIAGKAGEFILLKKMVLLK